MEITAKVLQVLPLQSGTSAKGEWKKQDVVFDTGGQFPKKVVVSFWTDLANKTKFVVGSTYNMKVDAESREFNGKWYTDIKAWSCSEAAGGASEAQSLQMNDGGRKFDTPKDAREAALKPLESDDSNDLPF